MAIITPFTGLTNSTKKVVSLQAFKAPKTEGDVVNLAEKKDQNVEKRLAGCMKEIQQLMKAMKALKKTSAPFVCF